MLHLPGKSQGELNGGSKCQHHVMRNCAISKERIWNLNHTDHAKLIPSQRWHSAATGLPDEQCQGHPHRGAHEPHCVKPDRWKTHPVPAQQRQPCGNLLRGMPFSNSNPWGQAASPSSLADGRELYDYKHILIRIF